MIVVEKIRAVRSGGNHPATRRVRRLRPTSESIHRRRCTSGAATIPAQCEERQRAGVDHPSLLMHPRRDTSNVNDDNGGRRSVGESWNVCLGRQDSIVALGAGSPPSTLLAYVAQSQLPGRTRPAQHSPRRAAAHDPCGAHTSGTVRRRHLRHGAAPDE